MNPPLSELSSVLFGEPPKPKFKQLCENIFDVPRSNLLDVLEDLQNAFWSDELPQLSSSSYITNTGDSTTMSLIENQTYEKQQEAFSETPNYKRPRLMADPTHLLQNSNKVISSIPGPGYDQQPTSPSPPSSPSRSIVSEPVYAKGINKLLVATTTTRNDTTDTSKMDLAPMELWSVKWQLFKQLKSVNEDYKEKQVIDLWYRFQRQGTQIEIQHMARYLLPVACSMRRWTVADAFRQVLIP